MTLTNDITFQRIRERAFELWDRIHRPEGLDIRFWLLAERELRAEAANGKEHAQETVARRDGSAS